MSLKWRKPIYIKSKYTLSEPIQSAGELAISLSKFGYSELFKMEYQIQHEKLLAAKFETACAKSNGILAEIAIDRARDDAARDKVKADTQVSISTLMTNFPDDGRVRAKVLNELKEFMLSLI